jgi:hypothetical protein
VNALKVLNVNQLREYLETVVAQDTPVNGYKLDGFSFKSNNPAGGFPIVLAPFSYDDLWVVFHHIQDGGDLFEHYGKI